MIGMVLCLAATHFRNIASTSGRTALAPALRAPITKMQVNKALPETLRYAVLIDVENAQHSALPLIMEEVAQFGSVTVRRVYGDFSKPELRPWKQVSLDQSFRAVNAFQRPGSFFWAQGWLRYS